MQIVIEIPEDKIPTKQCYKDALIKFVDRQVCEVTMIGQIPSEDDMGLWFDVLPEGHGDLITKEQAIELVEFYQINPQHFDFVNLIDEIKNEKPIIPADKEGD